MLVQCCTMRVKYKAMLVQWWANCRNGNDGGEYHIYNKSPLKIVANTRGSEIVPHHFLSRGLIICPHHYFWHPCFWRGSENIKSYLRICRGSIMRSSWVIFFMVRTVTWPLTTRLTWFMVIVQSLRGKTVFKSRYFDQLGMFLIHFYKFIKGNKKLGIHLANLSLSSLFQ